MLTDVSKVPVLEQYLVAFRSHDLPRCLGFYSDSAILEFGVTYCRDRPCRERWHRERFAANADILQVDHVGVEGELVTCEGIVTSDRLRAWGVTRLPVKATFRVQNGKIEEARFALRAGAMALFLPTRR